MIILNLSNVWCCYIVVSSHKLPVNPMKCHEIPMKSYEIPRVSRFFPSKTSAWGLREGRGRPGGGLCPHSWQLCRGIRLGRCVVIVVIRGENHGKSLWKPSEARKIGAFLTKIQWYQWSFLRCPRKTIATWLKIRFLTLPNQERWDNYPT